MQGPGCFQPGPGAYWVSRPRPASPRRRKVRCFRNGLAAIPQSLPCSSAPQPTRCAGLGWGPRIPDGLLLGGRRRVQFPARRAAPGALQAGFDMLGGSEFRLRQGFALRAKRLYGAKRRPIVVAKSALFHFRRRVEMKHASLLLLSPHNPLCWACVGAPLNGPPRTRRLPPGKQGPGCLTARPLCILG